MLAALALGLAACAEPEFITVCDRTETRQELVHQSQSVGEFGLKVGSFKLVTRTRCVESHQERNPRYVAPERVSQGQVTAP